MDTLFLYINFLNVSRYSLSERQFGNIFIPYINLIIIAFYEFIMK